MAKYSLRHFALGTAFIATMAACLYPIDEPSPHAPRAVRTTRPAPSAASALLAKPVPASPANVDPFAPRGWIAEPVFAAAPPQDVPIAAPVEKMVGPMPPPPAPAAPALPYQFVGQFTDEGNRIVYLSHGEKMVVARTGDTLDDGYRVLSMGAREIEFQHLPTGQKQLMSLPASDN